MPGGQLRGENMHSKGVGGRGHSLERLGGLGGAAQQGPCSDGVWGQQKAVRSAERWWRE